MAMVRRASIALLLFMWWVADDARLVPWLIQHDVFEIAYSVRLYFKSPVIP